MADNAKRTGAATKMAPARRSRGSANCGDCGSQWDGRGTAPVGSFVANIFGIHDLAGNAWEWVEDCFAANSSGAQVDGGAYTAEQNF